MRRRKLAILMIGLITVSVISGCDGEKKEVAKKPTKKVEVSKDKKADTSKKDETNRTVVSKMEKSDSKKTDEIETNVVNNNLNDSCNSGGEYVDYIPQQPEHTPDPQPTPAQEPEPTPIPEPIPQPVPELEPEPEPERVWVEEVGHMEPGPLIEEAWDEEKYEVRVFCFHCGADITADAENHACPDGSIHHGYGTDQVLVDVIHHPAIYGDPYWVVDIPGHYE